MYSLLLPLLLVHGAGKHDPVAEAPAVAARIDEFTAKQWQARGIQPASRVDDAAFLRRLTLDLVGRIPTAQEARSFAADPSPDKRTRAIRRLIESPEYALHLGRILDAILQDRFAGDGEFLEYLRGAVAQRRPWDRIFRDVLLGPWDAKEVKGAKQFLLRRLRNLDDLTTDTSRVFFGVNVSCARCHDHPLVSDWKQDHYYGMASFFNRTAGKGGKKGQGSITESAAGEVMFVTTAGQRRTAKMMFLSSKVIDEGQIRKATKGPFSRREQLVKVALEEKTFFSRAIVNQLWAFFIGRGLVHPVDQMHSANPPSIPGLLEWLGDDLAAHGYDLDRFVAGLVTSRVYQLSSTRLQGSPAPRPMDFNQAPLRPLTPQQFAVSLVLGAGDQSLDAARDSKTREARARALERDAARLLQTKLLDPRTDRYQSSTGEALFMSNHPEVQRLVEPTKTNLSGRLAALKDTREIVDTAVWTLLCRPPEAEERAFLVQWVEGKPDRAKACRELVWALLTSAEFRFNH
jgi:hypothetical protein